MPIIPTHFSGRKIIKKISSDACIFFLSIISIISRNNLSRIVRKPDFCLSENKGADQLRGNREADQRLCFRYTDSTISLLLKSEISSFLLFSELVQAGLCQTWSETPKTCFLASRLIYAIFHPTVILKLHDNMSFESRQEKTGLQEFRRDPTQTGVYRS